VKQLKRTPTMSYIITKSIHNKYQANPIEYPVKFTGSVVAQAIGPLILLTVTKTSRTLEHVIDLGLTADDVRHLITGLESALQQHEYLESVNKERK
jgi:hypothetical protein